MKYFPVFAAAFRNVLRETTRISLKLFKIMVPMIVAVKVLKDLGVVERLAFLLSPVMEAVGLPGAMGLVWATTLMTNLYGGMIVYSSIAGDQVLSVAQTTVLASMMLVAHGLPVELRIAQEAGVRLAAMGALRMAGAFLFGWCLHVVYSTGNWLQQPNPLSWVPKAEDPSLVSWGLGQVKYLVAIFFTIMALVILMRGFEKAGLTRIITRCLRPVLRLLGIGESASAITIVGMTLGLAYGGGLIIEEARSGRVSEKDVLFSLSLMGLAHSLVEDTLLTVLIGGHLSGILWGRIGFSLLCIFFLVKAVSRLSEGAFHRYLFHGGSTGGREVLP